MMRGFLSLAVKSEGGEFVMVPVAELIERKAGGGVELSNLKITLVSAKLDFVGVMTIGVVSWQQMDVGG